MYIFIYLGGNVEIGKFHKAYVVLIVETLYQISN